MTGYRVPLPYERPPLHENQRLNHYTRNRLVQQIKDDTHTLAIAAKLPRHVLFAIITLVWQPPADGRRRDDHNMTPTLKAAVDGLVRYGLAPDDNSRHVASRCVLWPTTPGLRAGSMWLLIDTGPGPGLDTWVGLLAASREGPQYYTDVIYQRLLDTAAARSEALVEDRTKLREALDALFTELWNHGTADPEHRSRLQLRLGEAQRVLHETQEAVPE